jgi:hypothetical protein
MWTATAYILAFIRYNMNIYTVVADPCLTIIIIHLSVLCLACVFRSNIIMCFKVKKTNGYL